MFDNKIFNFIILAGFLFIVYLCYKDNLVKKEQFKITNNYIIPQNLKKSILKKTKCSSKNKKKVHFILPEEKKKEFDYSYIDLNKINPHPNQYAEPPQEDPNITNNLCLNNKIDEYESFQNRLERVASCNKSDKPVSIKDVYDSLIVDYKRDVKPKELSIDQVITEKAAFDLSSYVDTNWSYNNESINNGGIMNNGLAPIDPKTESYSII